MSYCSICLPSPADFANRIGNLCLRTAEGKSINFHGIVSGYGGSICGTLHWAGDNWL